MSGTTRGGTAQRSHDRELLAEYSVYLFMRIPILLAVIFGGVLVGQTSQRINEEWQDLDWSLRGLKSMRPAHGFVPDEKTAARIAEAVAIAQ